MPKLNFRQVLSFGIVGVFIGALWANPNSEQLLSTLNNAFVAVIAYWLGSSQGAHESRQALQRNQDALAAKGTP